MERNRKKPPRKAAVQGMGYGERLALRVFGSVLLILAAIFIKQNAPQAAKYAEYALLAWTIPLP